MDVELRRCECGAWMDAKVSRGIGRRLPVPRVDHYACPECGRREKVHHKPVE